MTNPFYKHVDYTLRGKYVRAFTPEGECYQGWVDRIKHGDMGVLLHDAEWVVTQDVEDGETMVLGTRRVDSVMVRETTRIEMVPKVTPGAKIEYVDVDSIHSSPWITPDDDYLDDQFLHDVARDRYAGSFPVVRRVAAESYDYEAINGHKRLQACRMVGVEKHPVEVLEVDDETAKELVRLAHREDESDELE